MTVSTDILYEFAKITNDTVKDKSETTVYGTAVEYDGGIYIRLDGSDRLTPVTTTTDILAGDRVMVMIKNHTATVTGNISSPAARKEAVDEVSKNVEDVGSKINEFEIVIANKVDTEVMNAEKARIDALTADNVTIKERLTVNEADIDSLEADNATITGKLTANEAEITDLKANKLDVTIANAKYATIENLDATNTTVYNLNATYANFASTTINTLDAHKASIDSLEATKLSASQADLAYAKIDFTNIGEAAIEHFYATSGLIKDVTVGQGTVTGELVGVTIKGDLIEGGTVKADKLVILGEDGLYYKLNTNGETTEAEQTEYNSLDGSHILAQSITATKINVDDLVAFDATIGGFNITDSAIYSNAKASMENTTEGVYLAKDGQLNIGDGNSFLKYYKDADDIWRLEIDAGSIKIESDDIFETTNDIVNEAKIDIDHTIQSVVSNTVIDYIGDKTLVTDEENVGKTLYEIVTNIIQRTSSLEQTAGGWNMDFSTIETKITELDGKITTEQLERLKYIRFLDGQIILGDKDTLFQVVITNENIAFNYDGQTLSYIDTTKLNIEKAYIKEAEVRDNLWLGDFRWFKRVNGNLSLKFND